MFLYSLISILCVSYTMHIVLKFNRLLGRRINPLSSMVVVFYFFIILNFLFAKYFNIKRLNSEGAFYLTLGIMLISFVSYLVAKKLLISDRVYSGSTDLLLSLKKVFTDSRFTNEIGVLSDLCFILSIISYVYYFLYISRYITPQDILNNVRAWKNLELSSLIDVNSILFMPMHNSVIASILTLNFMIRKNKKSLAMLSIYILVSLVYPRRDPILIVLLSSFSIVSLFWEGKRLITIGLIFLLIIFGSFFFIQENITLGNLSRIDDLFCYTSGNISSFQSVVDSEVKFETNYYLQNSFYFIYAFMKYFDRRLAPPSVIKPNPEYGSVMQPNTYTAFADPVYEGGVVGLALYSIYAGIITGLICSYLISKHDLIAFGMYGCLFSVAVRSFINNTFGWLDIYGSLIILLLLNLIYSLLSRFRKPYVIKKRFGN